MKRIISCIMVFAMLLSMAACSSSGKRAPDSLLQMQVDKIKSRYALGITSWNAEHSYDQNAHTDTVTIEAESRGEYGYITTSATAVYQYDSSSDLWSLIRISSWSYPEYTFTKKLLGTHTLDIDMGKATINITKAGKNSVTLNCTIDVKSDAPQLKGEGTFTVTDSLTDIKSTADVRIPLSADGYGNTGITLYLTLSIAKGITLAHTL